VEGARTVILVRYADIDGPAQDGSELNDAGITHRDKLRHVLLGGIIRGLAGPAIVPIENGA
jgi:hypothetical protein